MEESRERQLLTHAQGIDLKNRVPTKKRNRKVVTEDLYMRLLLRVYGHLAQRTDSKFNSIIRKRLTLSRTNRPPISISKVTKNLGKNTDRIAVVVGPVTNDERCTEIPKMRICALKFTDTARARIEKAGGECMTFDQLALERPTGKDTLLLRGKSKAREVYKHFRKTHAKPYVRSKGRKFEMARGRRNSRGKFKFSGV